MNSIAYIENHTAEARRAANRTATLKSVIQSIVDNSLANSDNFDSSFNVAFGAVAMGSVCAYADQMNKTVDPSLQLMYLTLPVCASMNNGWGNEGLFTYIAYGTQQIMEKINTFLAGKLLSGKERVDFLNYYYQSAFLLKPAMESLNIVLNNSIKNKCKDWEITFYWVLAALLLYLVVYIAIMAGYTNIAKNEYSHYSIFYTIIPKEMRAQNAALREHVTKLIKISD